MEDLDLNPLENIPAIQGAGSILNTGLFRTLSSSKVFPAFVWPRTFKDFIIINLVLICKGIVNSLGTRARLK